MKYVLFAVLGAVVVIFVGFPVVGTYFANVDDNGNIATSETLVIEVEGDGSEAAPERGAASGLPEDACPENFFPTASVPDYGVPGGWEEDLRPYDVNGNGVVCVQDHPVREGDINVIDTQG